MINPQLAFAPSYARARVLFLEGAAAAGMAIRSHDHPLPGRDGETLAMDVALDGPVRVLRKVASPMPTLRPDQLPTFNTMK